MNIARKIIFFGLLLAVFTSNRLIGMENEEKEENKNIIRPPLVLKDGQENWVAAKKDGKESYLDIEQNVWVSDDPFNSDKPIVKSPSTEHFVPVIEQETGYELTRSPNSKRLRRSTKYIGLDSSEPVKKNNLIRIIAASHWKTFQEIEEERKKNISIQSSVNITSEVTPPLEENDKEENNIYIPYFINNTEIFEVQKIISVPKIVYREIYLTKKDRKWLKKMAKKKRKAHKKRWKFWKRHRR